MSKKKKSFMKKAGKKWAKASKWISNNINPDVLNGTYGSGGLDFNVHAPSIFDEMGGYSQPRRRTTHRKKSGKRRSSGKTITIRFD